MLDQRGRALRIVFTSNFWHGTLKQYVRPVRAPVLRSTRCSRACLGAGRAFRAVRHARIGFAGNAIIRGANSADVPVFDRGPRMGAELASRRRFVFTGRLIWHKAPTELAEAYRRYRAAVQDPWELHVVGAGPLAKDFDGIPGVTMHGFMQPEELSDIMHTSSCLILPSHIEWYGVVVHEGAAAGLPLICSDSASAALRPSVAGRLQRLDGACSGRHRRTGLSDAPDVGCFARATGRDVRTAGRALAGRPDAPKLWARNLHEEIERRISA